MKRRKIQAVCAHLGCDETGLVETAERVMTEAREARLLITAAEAALTRTEAEQQQLRAELAAASELLEARDDEALARNEVLTRLGDELAVVRQEAAALAVAVGAAHAEADRVAHEHAARTSELAAALEDARGELAVRDARIEAAEGHAAALAVSRAKLEAELDAQRLHAETLEAAIAGVHAEIAAQHQASVTAVAEAIADAVGLVAVLTDAVACFRQMLALDPADRARVHAAAGGVVDVARGWLADVGVELGTPGAHLLAIENEAERAVNTGVVDAGVVDAGVVDAGVVDSER